jgi:putative redox protein
MAIREKMLVNLVAQGTCPTHARTDVTTGAHALVIDEPVSNGGTDVAPTPLQTLVASLLGCTNVILNKIAARDGVSVEGLALKADAVLDRRGVKLEEELAIPFPKIDLTISFATDADPDRIQRLKADLGRFCPVSKILRQSGTQIEETWQVTHR